MVSQHQWWCPVSEYVDVQDDWFVQFFERGCADFDAFDPGSIEVYSVFGGWTTLSSTDAADDRRVRFLFVGENMTIPPDHPCLSRMDAVLSFFQDTPKSLRFPLWLIYWRFDEHGLFKVPQGHHRKDRAVIVVSHDNTRVRNRICEKVLREYRIAVDSTLPSLSHTHLINPPPPRGVSHKMNCISSYRYNICPENSLAQGYTTEKVFQSLAAGCVPIYWGCMPVENNVLRQDTILDVQAPFRHNINVSDTTIWTDDALVYIYATYLKVWSIAYRKLAAAGGGSTRRKDSVPIINYECESEQDAVDRLVQHWKAHTNFWRPRPVFRVRVEARSCTAVQELDMEDIADMVYRRYSLAIQ